MKIIADENIPFARDAFEHLGNVLTCPGAAIDHALIHDADALLVRSVTSVDRALLEGSSVRFVGSATIGTDHVDLPYLRESGVVFAYAPGSNADSVVEYVTAALLRLSVRHAQPLRGKTIGIVGCGNIGSRLARRLEALGLEVLRNDPPLAAEGGGAQFVPLDAVLAEADIVTLHVPLTRQGPWPTHHLFGRDVLARLKPEAWLINTSRGSVVDNFELRKMLEAGRPGAVVLDVWEGEPAPDSGLVAHVDLATPHVAGYSFDGKVKGTLMLHDALSAFSGRPGSWDVSRALAPAEGDDLRPTPPDPALPETDWLHGLVARMYDISADHARMVRLIDLPADEQAAYFASLRKNYPRRRAFAQHRLGVHLVPPPCRDAVERGLGVRLDGLEHADYVR